jgi:glycosyltransferase involved in cell wall biosynthesis
MSFKYPLVSVIVPAFNAEEYIMECLSSVINQTYRNLEIIVINDGSTDRTKDMLGNINDPRLIILNQPNKGCSAAKNIGLKISKGDFIQYLDADDYLSLDKIEKQLMVLKDKPNCTAVCKTQIISCKDSNLNDEISSDFLIDNLTGMEFLLNLLGSKGKFGMVQPNAYLITRNISDRVGCWNEEISPSPDEDGEYFSRILLESQTVMCTGGINFYRRPPSGNTLSKLFSMERSLNLLRTVDLKFQHIFKKNRGNHQLWLYQINISSVVYQFGVQYPEVIVLGKSFLQESGISDFQIIRPKKFRILASILGFENALTLKRLINRLIQKWN